MSWRRRARRVVSLRAATTLAASTAGALLLTALHVPAGGLFGAVLASALHASVRPGPVLPRPYRLMGLAVVGVVSGAAVRPHLLGVLASLALPLALAVLALLVTWLALTEVLVRRFRVDRTTALFATAPGGLSAISGMAPEVGADVQLIVAIHLVRVVCVVLIGIPMLGLLIGALEG